MFVEGCPKADEPVVESHIPQRSLWLMSGAAGLTGDRAARSGGEGQDDAASASGEGQRCRSTRRSAKATVLAEALGTLQSRRGPLSSSPIEWSTDTSA